MRILTALALLLLMTAMPATVEAARPLPGAPAIKEKQPVTKAVEEVAKQVRSKGGTSLSRSQDRPSLSRQAPRRIGRTTQPLFKDRNRSDSGPQRVQPIPAQPKR